MEIRPKFDLPDLSSLSVTVDNTLVTPDEVAERLAMLQDRFASLKGVQRPVADGDHVSIDLSASVDGKPVEDAQASGLSYPVGSESLLDGLDEALIGMSALCFGTVVLFGTLLTRDGFPVTAFLSIRFLGAAAVLAAVLLALHRPLTAASGEGVALLVLGVFGYAVESGLFFAAIEHGSAPAATLLFFTYPVWVSLIWVVVRRRLPDHRRLGMEPRSSFL